MSEKIRVITEEQYKEYLELKKQFDQDNNVLSKKVRWKPEKGEWYYFVNERGVIDSTWWTNEKYDKGCYAINNCFKTEEEAQKELDRRLAEQELLDLCDWDEDKYCCEIYYDFAKNLFIADCSMTSSCFSSYRFASGESVKKAIDTLGEEKLKLIFRIED